MKILLAIFSLLLFVGTASADSIWTYAGNTMTGCNCALDGIVTLDSSGNATAWDFTDGTHVLTQLTSTGFINHSPQTGANPFQTWTVSIDNGAFLFFSQFVGSAGEATDLSFDDVAQSEFGFLQGNHGIWTPSLTVATPEPATGLLLAGGLLCVGLMRRKSRKRLDSATWDKLA
jgi:PEP-CTERM motif